MRNKMDLLGGILGGLNLNPIPLEFGQSLSTTKELALILHKIDQVITFTNEWYNSILNDLENEGILYDAIIAHTDVDILSIKNNIISLSDLLTNVTNSNNTNGASITSINNIITNINNSINSISDNLNTLNYSKPNVNFSISPSNNVYKKGNVVNGLLLNVNISGNSKNILEIKYYKNNNLIVTHNLTNSAIDQYLDGTAINSDSSYYVTINDGVNLITSTIISINFLNPFKFGILNSIPSLINISTLSEIISDKENKDLQFTTNGDFIVFGYPSVFGDLFSILSNNEEILGAFTKINFNYNNENYTFYYTNDKTYVSSFGIVFRFN